MNNVEQRIRELPRHGPSEALDTRITSLLEPSLRAEPLRRPRRPSLAAAALAAGVAGFAAGLGTGHWYAAPSVGPDIGKRTVEPHEPTGANATETLVRLTDARVAAGLDFSQSLEPFQIQPVEQEGS